MKIIFTFIISTLALSIVALAEPSTINAVTTNSEYFICHFNNTVTEFERDELKQQGFQIFESESDSNTVYVKARPSAVFSTDLKSKMKELILVDKKGTRTYIIETGTEDSPDFLKLFFNFI